MHPRPMEFRLLVLGAAAVTLCAALEVFGVPEPVRENEAAVRASRLALRWFRVIETERERRSVGPDTPPGSPYPGMIGVEWSDITTTLGSLNAKITAANPAFAGLMVHLLQEAGVDSGASVGVNLSGSFPSLAVATLAALQTLEARPVVVSSLGASSFGANHPGATWIDMETWLRQKGGLRTASSVVTPGGDEDNGGGFPEGGKELLQEAARRNAVPLTVPDGFDDALKTRLEIFRRHPIRAFVNIGGNHTGLGTCGHGATLPTGLHFSVRSCADSGRGLIARMSEQGVPVVHLLNIRSLAAEHGIPLVPRSTSPPVPATARATLPARLLAVLGCFALIVILWSFRLRRVPIA